MLLLMACTTSKTIISDSANLDKYRYASLTHNNSSTVMTMQIYNAISATRLDIIGSNMIDELSPEQKEKLLLIDFSSSQNLIKSIVTVNFTDYNTGKPVASCKGSFRLGLDMNIATNRVSRQIKKLFPKD